MNESDAPDEGAQILPFPAGHESPQSSDLNVAGEAVTIIYLPWRHEVDGRQRPAGAYFHSANSSGFYADPSARGLDAVLNEIGPHLERHLQAVPDPTDGPTGE